MKPIKFTNQGIRYIFDLRAQTVRDVLKAPRFVRGANTKAWLRGQHA